MHPAIIRQRSFILHHLRQWFWENGYLEVQTPICVPSPAMEEHLEAIPCQDDWLHTSPEFAMKKILAHGIGRIYQIVPCFRDDEKGIHHSREFTMLEWYRIGAGWQDLMHETITLLQYVAKRLNFPLTSPCFFPTHHFLSPDLPPEEWFFRWVDEVEPQLKGLTIIYDYPAWQSALARVRGNFSERFEVYLHGIELANAFHEELSATEIRERWNQNNQNRAKHGKCEYPIDESLLKALHSMPRCSGIAMGIDRLVMAFSHAANIQQTQIEL